MQALRKAVVKRVVDKWDGWGGDTAKARLEVVAKDAIHADHLGKSFVMASGAIKLV